MYVYNVGMKNNKNESPKEKKTNNIEYFFSLITW